MNRYPLWKYLIIAALALVIYATIGIFTMNFQGFGRVSFSAGFGLYLSLLATIGGAFFSGVLAYLIEKFTQKSK